MSLSRRSSLAAVQEGTSRLPPRSSRVPEHPRAEDRLEQAGLSQREIATRSGVSPTTINRMASNLTGQVSLRTLDSLARALSEAGVKTGPAGLIQDVPEKGKRGRG
jgi:transcriptional regulator with XRE-family HTH domain